MHIKHKESLDKVAARIPLHMPLQSTKCYIEDLTVIHRMEISKCNTIIDIFDEEVVWNKSMFTQKGANKIQGHIWSKHNRQKINLRHMEFWDNTAVRIPLRMPLENKG